MSFINEHGHKMGIERIRMSHWSASRFSVLITTIALILLAQSMMQATPSVSLFGLIPGLPISYVAALALLTVAATILWLSHEEHNKLLFLQTSVLIVSLSVIPSQIWWGGTQGSHYSYYGYWQQADYIIHNGHFFEKIGWHTWPLHNLLVSSLVAVLGTSKPTDIIPPSQPILLFALSLLVYLFLRNSFDKNRCNYCWAGVWIFIMGSWLHDVFVPQVLGFFLLLTLLVMQTKPLAKEHRFRVSVSQLGSIVILAGLTIAHLFTSLAGLVATLAFSVTKKGKTLILVLIAALFIGYWMFIGPVSVALVQAPPETPLPPAIEETAVQAPPETPLPPAIEETAVQAPPETPPAYRVRVWQAFRLDELWQLSVVERLTRSEANRPLFEIKFLFVIILCVIGLGGFLIGFLHRGKAPFDITVLAIAVSFVFLGIAVGSAYYREGPDRTLLFLLPCLGYFGAKLLSFRGTAIILCLVLLFMTPLYLTSVYGAPDYLSRRYLCGALFFNEQVSRGSLFANHIHWSTIKYHPQLQLFSYEELQREGNKVVFSNQRTPPQYIRISQHDAAQYAHWKDKPQFLSQLQTLLDRSANCNLIYVNTDFRLYMSE